MNFTVRQDWRLSRRLFLLWSSGPLPYRHQCAVNVNFLLEGIDTHTDDVACFIYEPLIQGASGMLMHKPDDLDNLMTHCRQKGILMIQDEKTSYFSNLSDLLYPYFLSRGILLRPLGNIIYLVPPYCISDADLDYIYMVIIDAIDIL